MDKVASVTATTPFEEELKETTPETSVSGHGGRHVKTTWYRGVMFQATVVGLAAFAAPGLYNAMSSTGAGGQQTPYLVMAGNSILNCCMVLTCVFGSIIANKIGLKGTLIFGTTGYIYSAALYCNNRYGTQWFIYFGSAACGLTAGAFWAAEGAIMLAYPEPHQRGRYLAYWLAYRNSGSILGGAINLGLNATNSHAGKLDWRTYIVFVSLQCVGPFVAMLLSPPSKVQRKDGTSVPEGPQISLLTEAKAMWKLAISKDVLLILPFFFYATWELSYVGSFLTLYFSVRARALASLVSALAQVLTNILFGSFLDWRRLSLNTRARWGYIGMMTLIGACWIWGTVQNDYSNRAKKPTFDWTSEGFGRGWALYIFYQINFAVIYNYCFWMVGFMAKEPNELVRYTSICRGAEAAGGAIASGISSTSAPPMAALGVNFGLWAVAVIPTWFVVKRLGLEGYKIDQHAMPAIEDSNRERDVER